MIVCNSCEATDLEEEDLIQSSVIGAELGCSRYSGFALCQRCRDDITEQFRAIQERHSAAQYSETQALVGRLKEKLK